MEQMDCTPIIQSGFWDFNFTDLLQGIGALGTLAALYFLWKQGSDTQGQMSSLASMAKSINYYMQVLKNQKRPCLKFHGKSYYYIEGEKQAVQFQFSNYGKPAMRLKISSELLYEANNNILEYFAVENTPLVVELDYNKTKEIDWSLIINYQDEDGVKYLQNVNGHDSECSIDDPIEIKQ